MKKDQLDYLIKLYKERIDEVGFNDYIKESEGYKFDFINHFQNNFNLDAKDFYIMVDEALVDNNLTGGSYFFPKKMLLYFIEKDEIQVKKAFIHLFNESKDVEHRIDDFKKIFDDMMVEDNKKTGENKNTFIGLRFISLLLTSMYPDGYYFVKLSEYKRLAKYLDNDFKIAKGVSDGEKYKILSELADEVRESIKKAPEVKIVHDGFVDNKNRIKYKTMIKDDNYYLTTQDFIYITGNRLKGKKKPPVDKPEKKKIEDEQTKILKPVEISIGEILDELEENGLIQDQQHELGRPDKIKINSIIEKVKGVKWVIPHFQRYFRWDEGNIAELWESILKDYYVGSFLFWDADKNIEVGIKPIKGLGINGDEYEPEKIILDGQQRITSIYYALFSPSIEIGNKVATYYYYINFYNYYFQPDADCIEYYTEELDSEDTINRLLFPLKQLGKFKDWIHKVVDYLRANGYDDFGFRDLIDPMEEKLWHIWQEYEIPFISIPKTMNIGQVADIFEKINTKGKPLDTFDLLIARMYKYDIELKKIWDSTLVSNELIKKYSKKISKMPIYIFQALSLLREKNSSCKRKDIMDIYKLVYEKGELKFEEDWRDMSDYISDAIKTLEDLSDGFGVKDADSLPFAPTIPILAALFKYINNRNDKAQCIKKIKQWYWASVFSNSYSSSVDSQLAADFKQLKQWFDDDKNEIETLRQFKKALNAGVIDFINIKSWSNAQYKGIMSLLALEGAKDFDTMRELQLARANDRDHLFPHALVEDFNTKNIDSVLNMTWMSADTNRKIKRFEKPSIYTQHFIKEKYNGDEEEFVNKILQSHLISRRAYNYMLEDNFDGFINERQNLVLSRIKKLVGFSQEENITLITPETTFQNEKNYINTLVECDNFVHWIDLYFSEKGLEWINEAMNKNQTIREIKILMRADKTNEMLRKSYKKLRDDLKNRNINFELHIFSRKDASENHDRFIISKFKAYNVGSTDVGARGQLHEINESKNYKELERRFNGYWGNSLDIINDWDKIVNVLNK